MGRTYQPTSPFSLSAPASTLPLPFTSCSTFGDGSNPNSQCVPVGRETTIPMFPADELPILPDERAYSVAARAMRKAGQEPTEDENRATFETRYRKAKR